MYFWNKTLQVSDSSSVHHQEFLTVHTAMVYVIQVLLTACEQDQDGTRMESSMYDIYHTWETRRRWEDNIKMDLQEVGCGGMDWIKLVQDRVP